jgi:hypothetical protein
MPLEPDGLPRGKHALHVYPHSKLAKHRTVIKAAWALVNELIDRKDVQEVDLGRIVVSKGGREWEHVGVHCKQKGRELHLTCVATDAAQLITVTFRVGTDLQVLAQEIERNNAVSSA